MDNILAELLITTIAILIAVAVNNLFPNKNINQDSLDYYDYDYDDNSILDFLDNDDDDDFDFDDD